MAESLDELIKKEKMYHMSTYARLPVAFVKGKGTKLWDTGGKEYLDFIAGLGVLNIGHSHPKVVEAVKEQVARLTHVTNLFYTEPQLELAEKLAKVSFGSKCFFANSGAEANEGAVKLTRKYFYEKGQAKYKIITAWRSFHGRTLKMLAATAQPEKQKPFEPLPPGFKHVPLNDIEALKKVIDAKTAAVMLEPVQGEGGVYSCDEQYLRKVRQVCDENSLLLILDEVQTGVGRCGEMFAYQCFDIEPDIMTLAKGLASGLPIGALIAKEKVADVFKPGEHGATFGGGPVVTLAALKTLEVIEEEGLIAKAKEQGVYFKNRLEELKAENDLIEEVRGLGLMLGIELKQEIAKEVVLAGLNKGVIFNNIGAKIIRFLPPLCVTKDEIDQAIDILKVALKEVQTVNSEQ